MYGQSENIIYLKNAAATPAATEDTSRHRSTTQSILKVKYNTMLLSPFSQSNHLPLNNHPDCQFCCKEDWCCRIFLIVCETDSNAIIIYYSFGL